MAFERVAVLGPGLLGGSLGLALRARGLAEVRFWGRSGKRVAEVVEAGFLATTDLVAAVEGADLVILATPVESYPHLARELVACQGNFAVTDVGSVKGAVAEGAGGIFAEAGVGFVGSHPMAGSEQGGFECAREDLFQDAACFVCARDGEKSLGTLVSEFWQALGCRVTATSASEHDQVVARISHLPHALAAVGARVALRNPAEGAFGGGGLWDTTRVAGGNPSMWKGILLGNRTAVLAELERARNELAELSELVAQEEEAALVDWLQGAKELRDQL